MAQRKGYFSLRGHSPNAATNNDTCLFSYSFFLLGGQHPPFNIPLNHQKKKKMKLP